MPRSTATLDEKEDGYYAIDPSLADAGVPPPIIPLEVRPASWPLSLELNELVGTTHHGNMERPTGPMC